MVSVVRSFICIIILFLLTAQGWAQSIDLTHYYRLTTQFRGAGMALDVFNGGAKNNMMHLTGVKDVSGQYWRFQPAGHGYYRLTTMFRGRNMCLDVFNGGAKNNQVHLTQCANYSGQFWKVISSGNWIRFKTQFRGDGMCLDVFNGGPNNNQPHLSPCAKYSGQNWLLSQTSRLVDRATSAGDSVTKQRPKKTNKLRVGSCAYWKDQWKQSGSRGAYRKMSDACGKEVGKNCGRNAHRSTNGKCHCNKNYERRQGRCQWKVDSKGFEVAPWKKSGCKTWLQKCNSGNGAACRKHEETCQVN